MSEELENEDANRENKEAFRNFVQRLSPESFAKSVKFVVALFVKIFRNCSITRLRAESNIISRLNTLHSRLKRLWKRVGKRLKESLNRTKKRLSKPNKRAARRRRAQKQNLTHS